MITTLHNKVKDGLTKGNLQNGGLDNQTLEKKEGDIIKIEDDITENMQNIIKHIEIHPFRIIMEKYREKIMSIKEDIQKEKQDKVNIRYVNQH